MGARVYVGGLEPGLTERDLEDDFKQFGRIHYVWVARKPPGFAFIDFEDARDADDAVRRMNGAHGWRVEISRKSYGARGGEPRGGGGGPPRSYGGGGGGGGGREMACYNCGEVGHLARDCRARGVPPRRDRSPVYDRRRSLSPRGRSRSRSPVRRASPSPVRRGGRSGSPPHRRDSPPPRSPRDRSP